MATATPKPTVYPIPVSDARVFQVGENLVVEGFPYVVVAVDDPARMIFARPLGKRRQRRAAVRAAFR